MPASPRGEIRLAIAVPEINWRRAPAAEASEPPRDGGKPGGGDGGEEGVGSPLEGDVVGAGLALQEPLVGGELVLPVLGGHGRRRDGVVLG